MPTVVSVPARRARAIVAKFYFAPRVTGTAKRLFEYGLMAGLALDITFDDFTGQPYDFSLISQRDQAISARDDAIPRLSGVN